MRLPACFRRTPAWLALWPLLWLALCAFRCGPIAETCLSSLDCPTNQRCTALRCLPQQQTPDASSERARGENPASETFVPDGSTLERGESGSVDGLPVEHEPIEGECAGDEERGCYAGTSGTKNKGICRIGKQFCRNGRWGVCEQQVLPQDESCNGKDNNCDGQIDLCNLGEWCEPRSNPCKAGLSCHQFRCHTPCDSREGAKNNPGCPGTHICYDQGDGKGVCKLSCYPNKGGDQTCAIGDHCFATQEAGVEPGFCIPNTPPGRGPKQLGEPCQQADVQRQCDGSKGLVCLVIGANEARCVQACIPTQRGGTGCVGGKQCIDSRSSFLSGICQ